MASGHCHACAPKAWRRVPDLTGDYDLDATIEHRDNTDMAHRLALYVRKPSAAYNPRNAYHGYSGYHGDE